MLVLPVRRALERLGRRQGSGRATSKRVTVIDLKAAIAEAHAEEARAAAAPGKPAALATSPDAVWPPPAPPAEENAHPNGVPTPFRKSMKLNRTPARPEDDAPEVDAARPPCLRASPPAWPRARPTRPRCASQEPEEVGAVPINWAPEAAASPEEDAGVSTIGTSPAAMPPPPPRLSTIGTSPLRHEAPSKRPNSRSFGTSPLVPPSPASSGYADHEFGGGEMDDDDLDGPEVFGGEADVQAEADAAAMPPPPPPAARKRGEQRKRRNTLERLEPIALPPDREDGTRRSMRKRFRPLQYWRNERVVYGRRESAKFEAIVDVVTVEREATPRHFRKRKDLAAQAEKEARAIEKERAAAKRGKR